MQIIKSDKELALWRYRISRAGVNSTDDTIIAISFHGTNGDLFPLVDSTNTTRASMLVTLAYTSTGISLLSLAQTYISSGITTSVLEACPSARIAVVSGPAILVRGDINKNNAVNSNFNQDGPYSLTKGKILCIGGRHPISDIEEFTLGFDGGTLIGSVCTERIVTPNTNFIFTPLTIWGYDGGFPSQNVGAGRSGLILFDQLTAENDGIGASNGLLINFGGGDTTKAIWGTGMFDLDNSNITNGLIKREGVGSFSGPYIGIRWGSLVGFSDASKSVEDLSIRIGTRKEAAVSNSRINGSLLENPLNDYYFKAVSANVSYSGYFSDVDGNIASTLEDGSDTSARTGLFISGTISTTGWSRLNSTYSFIPPNATAFVGRKDGDVYVIKSLGATPANVHLHSASSTLDSVGGPVDSRTDFWVIGALNDNSFFPSSAGSVSSGGGGSSSSSATVAFTNILVASASASAASTVVIQSYNSAGIAVDRQTITIPVRSIGSGSTLSSLLTGYASTWVAAKITDVSGANFYIVESTGTVVASTGAQVIAVGDYSTDPITINGDLL